MEAMENKWDIRRHRPGREPNLLQIGENRVTLAGSRRNGHLVTNPPSTASGASMSSWRRGSIIQLRSRIAALPSRQGMDDAELLLKASVALQKRCAARRTLAQRGHRCARVAPFAKGIDPESPTLDLLRRVVPTRPHARREIEQQLLFTLVERCTLFQRLSRALKEQAASMLRGEEVERGDVLFFEVRRARRRRSRLLSLSASSSWPPLSRATSLSRSQPSTWCWRVWSSCDRYPRRPRQCCRGRPPPCRSRSVRRRRCLRRDLTNPPPPPSRPA